VVYEPLESKRIYLDAEELADAIWDIAVDWPEFPRRSVGLQLVRAADSIGANISEGHGRHHVADVCKFLYYARASLRETKFWLRRAVRRRLMDQATFDQLDQQLEHLARELSSTINYQKRRTN